MIVVVFRSRLRPEHAEEYRQIAEHIDALAATMPGFLGIRSYAAQDGERVSIAHFASEEAVDNWREHPEHREAQRRGREEFYSQYSVQVCQEMRSYTFGDNRPE